MNLYVYTAAPTLANAVAASATDLSILVAALANPLDVDNATNIARVQARIPEFTLGDSQALNIYFYRDASTLESWSGLAGHTVTVGLGLLDLNGDQLLTSSTLNVATNCFTGNLSLNTPTLISRVRGAITDGFQKGRWFSSPYSGARFPIQIRHVDPNGNYQTCALWEQMVRDRVIANAPADSGTQPSTTYLTLAEAAALFLPRGQGYEATSNASGNTNVSPASNVCHHTEVINFSGSSNTTRVVALLTASRVAGDDIALRLNLPATSGITVEVRSGTAAGTLLTSLTTDGTGDDAICDYYYDGSAYQRLRTIYPA